MKTMPETEDRRPKEDFGPFGGRVWLEPLDGGTRAAFELPLADEGGTPPRR